MKPTLLILAAGMGSRYGGLKQLDQMGPNGETILDYSVKYAAQAGYGKVVLVIRRSMEADFQEYILPRYKNVIPVEYVFQELDMLPAGFSVNPERVKPYGTAHAILVAKDAIKEPFTVINADDFYGKEPFQILADYLTKETANDPSAFAMVGYRLANTLSENGTVSRGVCQVDGNGYLTVVKEMRKIPYGQRNPERRGRRGNPAHRRRARLHELLGLFPALLRPLGVDVRAVLEGQRRQYQGRIPDPRRSFRGDGQRRRQSTRPPHQIRMVRRHVCRGQTDGGGEVETRGIIQNSEL